MRGFAVLLLVCGIAKTAEAQREFIEELEQPRAAPANDDVDLDAPDVPAVKPKAVAVPGKPTESGAPKAVKDPTKALTKEIRKVPKPAVKPPVEVVDRGFEIRPTSSDAFFEKLAPHFLAAQKGEIAGARKTLPEIEQAELDFGMPGVSGGFQARSLGFALAREAEAAVVDARTDEVLTLAEAAARAAPDDVATLIALSHLRWTTGDPVAVLTSLGALGSAVCADPVALSSVIARAAAASFAAVMVLLLVLGLVVALPALSLLAFDVWLLLPRGSHILQSWVLVVLAAAAPFVAGAGLVFSLLWVLTLGMLYMTPRSRLVVVVVGVLVAGLPVVTEVFSRALVVPGSDAARLHLALFDVDGVAELQDLRTKESAAHDLSLLENAALALAARREGRLDESLQRWKSLVAKNADVGWVHGGYGVALANAGDDDLALAELGLALQRVDEGAVIAAFDGSLIHHKAGRSDKAQGLMTSVGHAAAVVGDLRRATFRGPDEVVGHNRAYIDILPPRHALVSLAFEPSDAATAVAQGIARPLWRGLLGATAVLALGAFPLLWLVLVLGAKRLPVARACSRCGAAASARADGPDVPAGTCAGCFHVFLSTKSRVDGAVRLQKERAILQRSRRRSRLVTLLSLFPGAGHLFAGAAFAGAVLTFSFTLCAAGIVVALDLVPGPRPNSLWSSVSLVAPLAVTAIVVFLVGLRSALGVAADERAGGRQ